MVYSWVYIPKTSIEHNNNTGFGKGWLIHLVYLTTVSENTFVHVMDCIVKFLPFLFCILSVKDQ